MKIDREIRGRRVVTRRLDIADGAPAAATRECFCHISPVFAAVAREVDQSIVAASPDQSFFFRRLGNCKQRREVFDADVVSGQAA